MTPQRTSKATREAAFSATLLDCAIAKRDAAVHTMTEQVNGYGGGHGGRGSGHSDPTPLLVEKRDRAAQALDRERVLRGVLKRTVDEYASLIAGYQPAAIADDQARRETEADNTPKCMACAAAGFDVPYHRRTDMGGILSHPMWLCGWHIKQIRKTGRLPTEMEVHDHHHRRERIAS